MRGLSEENGSWNTIWMSRRRSRSAASLALVMSLPCSRMRPPSGFSRRSTVLPTRGLAAAALAHHAERLAGVDGEADAVHGVDVARAAPEQAMAHGEALDQVVDLEDRARAVSVMRIPQP